MGGERRSAARRGEGEQPPHLASCARGRRAPPPPAEGSPGKFGHPSPKRALGCATWEEVVA